MLNIKLRNMILLALAVCYGAHAQGALTISSTRIVQSSDKQSSTVVVANPSEQIFAAQAWVNTIEDDSTTAVPLIASPALFRLDPGGEQTVQINRLPNDLPDDRESLFFFNVQEIPQAADEKKNTLTIALRTRIKLFYRPAGLPGNTQESLNTLEWTMASIDGQSHLQVNNPSPYYFTFSKLKIDSGEDSTLIDTKEMVGPFSTQAYAINDVKIGPTPRVTFTTISDFGGTTPERSVPLAQ